jgi:hypothetical protein
MQQALHTRVKEPALIVIVILTAMPLRGPRVRAAIAGGSYPLRVAGVGRGRLACDVVLVVHELEAMEVRKGQDPLPYHQPANRGVRGCQD